MMHSDSIVFFLIRLIGLMFCGVAWDQNFVSALDGNCTFPAQCPQGSFLQNITPVNINNSSDGQITDSCRAFYESYIYYAGEFTDCELKHSRPFRMCMKCVVQHELTFVTYDNFVTDTKLNDCRAKYMRGDRVQIVPSMQAYIEKVWSDSACTGCTQDVHVDIHSGNVTYRIPDDIRHFIQLFYNLSLCLNESLQDPTGQFWQFDIDYSKGNLTTVCNDCLVMYEELNTFYGQLSDSQDGNICMDIVDRMNHTRLAWSNKFGCGCRSSDSLAVIMIAISVGVLPIIFYGILRYIGKEKKSKVFKQKRLASANANFSSTNSGTSSTTSSLL